MLRGKNRSISIFVWDDFTNDARVYKQCKTLSEAGYEVTLICLKYGEDLPDKTIEQGFKVIRIRTEMHLTQPLWKKSLLYIVPSIKMLCLGFKMNSDVYHSNDLNTLAQGVLCGKLRFNKKRVIYDSHEIQTERMGYNNPLIGRLEKILLQFVDKVVTTTETRASYLEQLYDIDKPIVVHNFPEYYDVENVEMVDLHKLLKVDRDKLMILYQGGLQEGRGLEGLLLAMQNVDNATLVFLGSGKLEKKLKEITVSECLEAKVKFLSAVPKEVLKCYTVAADLGFQMLQNSCFNHYSALSNKLLEYIMAEVPVIVNKGIPEMESVVLGYKIGVLVDGEDIHQLSIEINKLLENVLLRKQMKQNCKECKTNVSWSNEKDKFLELYA